jgi:hypothetical protein
MTQNYILFVFLLCAFPFSARAASKNHVLRISSERHTASSSIRDTSWSLLSKLPYDNGNTLLL